MAGWRLKVCRAYAEGEAWFSLNKFLGDESYISDDANARVARGRGVDTQILCYPFIKQFTVKSRYDQ